MKRRFEAKKEYKPFSISRSVAIAQCESQESQGLRPRNVSVTNPIIQIGAV